MSTASIGLIGLAVMGQNLALNIEEKGFPIAVFNRTTSRMEEFVAANPGKRLLPCKTIEQLVQSLERPRRIIVMVKAGDPVDQQMALLQPHLSPGDIFIDAGNSWFQDTERRAQEYAKAGLRYVGMGVSGGEEGARHGPSIMPGGEPEAYELLAPILTKIAAQVDDGPCVAHIGPGGAGHFVKMVHNGVEYGLMQAYAEGFQLLQAKEEFDLDLAGIAQVWRFGSVIRSWLLDRTADALAEDPRLEALEAYVEDSGEGRWTVKESVDLGVPAPVITLALQERFRSRQESSFADRLLAAMRQQFGGHAVRKAK